MTAPDERTREYLGLPGFRRLFGFGDRVEIRARMTTAIFFHVDRAALAAALPKHPRVALHPASPLVLIQSDVSRCADDGDPQHEDHPYREVMLACVLEGAAGLFGAMWPFVLYLDDPIATMAGREYQGFPKVLAGVRYAPTSAEVDYAWRPRGVPTVARVLSTRWSRAEGSIERAAGAVKAAILRGAHAVGIADHTIDALAELALAPAGEVWNLQQLPDLADHRRASLSRLTRFKPRVREPSGLSLLHDFAIELPSARDEPSWSLGARFFGAGDEPATRAATFAFEWEATLELEGGEVLDEWR